MLSTLKYPIESGRSETILETDNKAQQQDNEITENNEELIEAEPKTLKEDKKQINTKSVKKNNKVETEAIGKLSIPDINLKDKLVYEGTSLDVLSIGIGHFTNTSICNGNVGLASHNSGGKGDDFKNLKNIKYGSKIYYETKYDKKTYIVEIITEISDEDWSYLSETKDNRITLLTCISGKPNNRLCVQGIEKI